MSVDYTAKLGYGVRVPNEWQEVYDHWEDFEYESGLNVMVAGSMYTRGAVQLFAIAGKEYKVRGGGKAIGYLSDQGFKSAESDLRAGFEKSKLDYPEGEKPQWVLGLYQW